MKQSGTLLRLITSLFFLQLSVSVKCQAQLPFVTDSIYSAILNESRELRVILPTEYTAASHQRYEVLYILDGEWYQELVPFTYNFAESAGYVPKSIFVLIRNRYSNGRNLRDRDFSPTHVAFDSLTGGANNFYDFLTREVVPYIEHKYPAGSQRSLIGSSYSGLFSVFAFLKDPSFFQSFIASDPNINFDQHYVTGLAVKTLPRMTTTAGTLFIAGRPDYYRNGGVLGFDSVLKAYAPKTLHWQCVPYDNETHYSIQLKAFYEGFRFSHYGYSASQPEFHPMNGMVSAGKSFYLYFLNNNPSARFTVNGTEPTKSSAAMVRDDTVSISAPGQLRVKTFPNRSAYMKEWTAAFTTGSLSPVKTSNKILKTGLRYRLFKGNWDSIPDIHSLTPSGSGAADSLITINTLLQQQAGLLQIDGLIDVPADAEYIFFVNGFNAVQLTVGGKAVFGADVPSQKPSLSYIVSLKKGRYALKLSFLHKAGSPEPHFTVFTNAAGKERWWENRVLDL